MKRKYKYYQSNYLKEKTAPEFAAYFKHILCHKGLSWGCRVFLFSLATIPRSTEYSDRKLARKLNTQGHQIAKWRHEAEKKKVEVSFRPLF